MHIAAAEDFDYYGELADIQFGQCCKKVTVAAIQFEDCKPLFSFGNLSHSGRPELFSSNVRFRPIADISSSLYQANWNPALAPISLPLNP